ncbi:deoxyribodipyrimidine photo-lyase [Fodinicurvata sp. EGI_FJ10296]|uniref:deoxyribodipyrimidine photo-lyase n=1 Tax=Fodinicurvata sp. EGI_FJ10296 TaxID=3231908 RepID=UPI0034542DE0
MIHDTRIRSLNARNETAGRYVLYWMQAAQRSRGNHALELAIRRGNALGLPIVVGFGLTESYPEANARHYRFMLDGLREVADDLAARGIAFVIRFGQPAAVAIELAAHAAFMVVDRNDLRMPRRWRREVAEAVQCPLVEVETDVVVPVDVASGKYETQARTLRPRLHRHLADYLEPLADSYPTVPAPDLADLPPSTVDLSDPAALVAALPIDQDVGPVRRLTGGRTAGIDRLSTFIKRQLKGYGSSRNEPAAFKVSFLSPYLHFGQISALEIALTVQSDRNAGEEDRKAFLEELIVRRELAFNFVRHHPDSYDSLDCLPDWARKSLDAHRHDRRDPLYDRATLEAADTHDRYWNAAMREMLHTGFMHNYMRMYWGKKILEWMRSPEEAFETTIYLNNKYFLDGRDPNSFANVLWIYGLHDRAWTERPIFGKTRYMAASGLERKFNIKAYVSMVDYLVEKESAWT